MCVDSSTYYTEALARGGSPLRKTFRSGYRMGPKRRSEGDDDRRTNGRYQEQGAVLQLDRASDSQDGRPAGGGFTWRQPSRTMPAASAEVDIATAYAKAGRWDDAMKVVESIRTDAPRFVALCRVGRAAPKRRTRKPLASCFASMAIAKDLKLNGEPDPTGPDNVAPAQWRSQATIEPRWK